MERIDIKSWKEVNKMSGKTLELGDVDVNKKEFHPFKKLITLNLVEVDKIVLSDKYQHSDEGFEFFIG